MINVFRNWYNRKFSDPDAATLAAMIVVTMVAFALWGNMLMPVIVALVLAYLLDWPVERPLEMLLWERVT